MLWTCWKYVLWLYRVKLFPAYIPLIVACLCQGGLVQDLCGGRLRFLCGDEPRWSSALHRQEDESAHSVSSSSHLVLLQHFRHMRDANRANVVCFSFTEQLTKDSAKIKAHIRMVLEVSLCFTILLAFYMLQLVQNTNCWVFCPDNLLFYMFCFLPNISHLFWIYLYFLTFLSFL